MAANTGRKKELIELQELLVLQERQEGTVLVRELLCKLQQALEKRSLTRRCEEDAAKQPTCLRAAGKMP